MSRSASGDLRMDPHDNARSLEGAHAALGEAVVGLAQHREWKKRFGPSGIHLFERAGGLNILLDEVTVHRSCWSRGPRQVSIALTNRCDLACVHCFAPKSRGLPSVSLTPVMRHSPRDSLPPPERE